MPETGPDKQVRSGLVAVVGRANAGKSTLINRIVGEKVCIVSPVVQTTRRTVRGILTDERGQLTLLDTPGLHQSRSGLSRSMNRQARMAIEGVDAVLLVLDGSREAWREDAGWMKRLAGIDDLPLVFLLNKSDAGLLKSSFEDLWKEVCSGREDCDEARIEWLEGSAATGEGVPELVEKLFALLPYGPLLFDPDTISDHPRKLAIADVIQEKLFLLLEQELPHSIAVKVDSVTEGPETWNVAATIMVQRHSQKGIVLGNKGRRLRAVKRQAEPELSSIFDIPVRLDLWVKVEKNWDQNYFLLQQMGYAGI